jgi:hypothetical protein
MESAFDVKWKTLAAFYGIDIPANAIAIDPDVGDLSVEIYRDEEGLHVSELSDEWAPKSEAELLELIEYCSKGAEMRYIGLLNEDGTVVEEGYGPHNADFTAIIGRPAQPGDRWIDGKGDSEEAAKEAAMEWPYVTEA